MPGPAEAAKVEEEVDTNNEDIEDGQRSFLARLVFHGQLISSERFVDDERPFDTPESYSP